MTYRTTCLHCASVFRLGTDQLDAAAGWVQCSVCGSAFDAYPGLLMEDGSPLAVTEPEAAAALPDPVAATPDTDTSPGEAKHEALGPAADDPEEARAPQGIVQRETPLDLPSIILIDPDAPPPDGPGPLPHIQAPAYPASHAAPAYPAEPANFDDKPPVARVEYAKSPPAAARSGSVPRRTRTWGWIMASLFLLIGLLAQTAYFLRDTLVSQLPQSRPVFEQACAALGCILSLPQNLTLLQVVGSDLQTEASGRLKLSLTLGNRARHTQAWPVLVLTLTDQRNRPLARRSFAPSEYLSDAGRIAAGVPPMSEQVLSLPLTVRDLAPMGFDLKLTY